MFERCMGEICLQLKILPNCLCCTQINTTQMVPTHSLVKVDGIAHEGGVVDEVKARPVLCDVALGQQPFFKLYIHTRLKHSGVPQAVHHDDYVMVELTEHLAADVKGLLKKKQNKKTERNSK